MTSIFDGMAGALNDTFGAPVSYRQQGRTSVRDIKSVFRTEPILVLGEDGAQVSVERPTWRVPLTLADGIKRGDLIEPSNGLRYRLVNRVRDASPGADRFVTFDLEEVAT